MISMSNVKLCPCDGVFVAIHFGTMYNAIKQLLDSVFVISGIIKVSVSVISLGLLLFDKTYLDLDYSGYHKNLSNNSGLLSVVSV